MSCHPLVHPRRMIAALMCAAVVALATMSGLQAQSARVPGPPADTLVDVLITFRSAPGAADEALVRGAGGTVRFRYHLVPGIAARIPSQAVAALAANPRVVVVEPDGQVFAIDHDPELANTWGVAHIGAGTSHHTYNAMGSGVRVGVIDSGIDYTHADLAASYAFGHNFLTGSTDPMDDNGHGTHVAGTIAAVKNGIGVVGAAPEASLVGLKVLNASGSGSFSHVIAAVQFAVDNHIRITNNSYGSSSNPGTLVQAAFDTSAERGVLHIAAAGNSGNCGGASNSVGWPARYTSVVAVAATGRTDQRACFSSTGPALELSAPGVGIRSTVPGGGYANYNGTSMASPHVAGVAALIAGIKPLLDAGAIRQILRETARPLGAVNHYGHGLVDAVAAVEAGGATATDPPPPNDPPADDPPDEDPPPSAAPAKVSQISYSTNGGPQGNRHLSVTIAIATEAGTAISGAVVAMTLTKGASTVAGTGTTGSAGTVTFTWNNAPAGCYSTEVMSVTASGFDWNGVTPPNGGC